MLHVFLARRLNRPQPRTRLGTMDSAVRRELVARLYAELKEDNGAVAVAAVPARGRADRQSTQAGKPRVVDPRINRYETYKPP